MSKTHEQFSKDLIKSGTPMFKLAQHLWPSFDIRINRLQIAPTTEQRWEYVDGGDLFIKDVGGEHKLECKGSGVTFHSLEDWPYPNIIVDEAYKIGKHDDSDDKPLAYCIVSNDLTGYISINWKHRGSWWEEDVYDRFQGENRTFMFSSLDNCKYFRFNFI